MTTLPKLTGDLVASHVLQPIHFPAPSASWGRIIKATIPNPKWRWWTFWRPRVLMLALRNNVLKGRQ